MILVVYCVFGVSRVWCHYLSSVLLICAYGVRIMVRLWVDVSIV